MGIKHNERCHCCKDAIRKLLQVIYGEVDIEPKVEIPAALDDYKGRPYYDDLKKIYKSLQGHRGYKDFVNRVTLPRCDMYVPKGNFLVEFDESQHFTSPRAVALSNYPSRLKTGFDRKKWITLCGKLHKNDPDPKFRDEQRAWYDTLRDFLPKIKRYNPTVRFYMGDYKWCELDPKNKDDVEHFKAILDGKPYVRKSVRKVFSYAAVTVSVREENSAEIARVVLVDNLDKNKAPIKEILLTIMEAWPKGKKVKYLILPGGVASFKDEIEDFGNDFKEQVLRKTGDELKEFVDRVFHPAIRKALAKHTDVITLGVDNIWEHPNRRRSEVESVIICNLKTGKDFITGKTYPTPSQERRLVMYEDLQSHFLNLNGEKVLILGCHDLNMFSSRTKAVTKGWRNKRLTNFIKLTKKEKPTVVFQHPHTTDSHRIWVHGWSGLRKEIPSVRKYASAIRYANKDGGKCRGTLDEVLARTKEAPTIDFIVKYTKKTQ